MKKFILLLTAIIMASCNGKADKEANALSKDSTTIAKPETRAKPEANTHYLTSTFDDNEFSGKISDVQDGLAALYAAGAFDSLSVTQKHKLSESQLEYFKNSRFSLIYATTGSLFAKGQKDLACITYDTANNNITLLLFNENKGWGELYRDYKVATGLENAGCNYGMFGTLDYLLADELVYLKDDLIKHPESLLELTPCMITNFAEDENFTPENCCFAKGYSKNDMGNSLCIATSFVYNSWECLKYNPDSKSFTIYYGQAWAD
jgi:hypothetical protein